MFTTALDFNISCLDSIYDSCSITRNSDHTLFIIHQHPPPLSLYHILSTYIHLCIQWVHRLHQFPSPSHYHIILVVQTLI